MSSLVRVLSSYFVYAALVIACARNLNAQVQTSTDNRSLGTVARELRAERNAAQPDDAIHLPSQNTLQEPAAAVVNDPPEIQRFMDQTKALLMREEFAELDKIADEARSSKARFPGGGWKLSRFYEAINNGQARGYETDADWQDHLALIQRWVTARPKSITARVALADAYHAYAWAARGTGYTNTVTNQGWQLFEERAKKAAEILKDSATLTPQCPKWYELMQQVAMSLGADKDQQRAIFEKAIAFEPLFFAYYNRFAIALLPKWVGEPGDTEAFAEEMYRRIGGKQGAYIYFEIASSLCGSCGEFSADGYSWPKLQEGFAALEGLYGLTPLKLNRYAFLAATYGDKAVAAKAFARIGSNWDRQIWGTRARFESQRSWAGLPATPPANASVAQSAQGPTPPPSAQVEQLLQLATTKMAEGQRSESTQLAQQAIKTAESLPGTGEQLGRGYMIIANNEQAAGHIPKAQTMLDKAVSSVSERAGSNSLELATTLTQAALYAQGMNDYARAETNLRRAIEIREKANGTSDRELSNQLTILGNLLLIRGRDKEALDLYQRAISNREAVNPDDLFLVQPLEQRGVVLEKMGRNQEAEASFLRMLKLMEGHLGLNDFALTDPLSKLANLYHATGKPDDERRMQERLQKVQANARN